MKRMMKKTVILLTVFFMAVVPLKAQVFIADDEFEGTMRLEESEFVLFAPVQAQDGDQSYTPIGNGVLLLAGLGGAYLLTKRKKQK